MMFDVDQHIGRNLARRVEVIEVDDSGPIQSITVVGLADEYFTLPLRGQPFGLSGVPPVGSIGYLFAANGRLDQGFLIGMEHPDYRPRDLVSGSCRMYGKEGQEITQDELGNTIIKSGASGVVKINPSS